MAGRPIYPPAGSAQAELAVLARNVVCERCKRRYVETIVGGGGESRPTMTSGSLGESLQNFHGQMLQVASTDLIKGQTLSSSMSNTPRVSASVL